MAIFFSINIHKFLKEPLLSRIASYHYDKENVAIHYKYTIVMVI